ncbi:hypothetical protein BVY04_05035, partial [bacterium M21]
MRIICFGDSLTTCGGEGGRYPDILQHRFPTHTFINKGVSGETWEDATLRVEKDVLALNPDLVLLQFGGNDWLRNERPYQRWAEDLEQVVRALRAKQIQVILLGIFGPYSDETEAFVEKTFGIDDRARAYRELERTIAATYGCHYVGNVQQQNINHPTHWYDPHHANEYGNRHVADMIEPVLQKLLGSTPLPIRKPNIRHLGDFWQEAVDLNPNAIAVIAGENQLTYRAANTQVKIYAARLTGLGCESGGKVAVCLPNNLALIHLSEPTSPAEVAYAD